MRGGVLESQWWQQNQTRLISKWRKKKKKMIRELWRSSDGSSSPVLPLHSSRLPTKWELSKSLFNVSLMMAEGHLSADGLVWAPEGQAVCLLTRSEAPLCHNEALLNARPVSGERRGGETLLCFIVCQVVPAKLPQCCYPTVSGSCVRRRVILSETHLSISGKRRCKWWKQAMPNIIVQSVF